MNSVAFTHLRDVGPLPTLVAKSSGTSVLEKLFTSEGLPVAAAYGASGYVPVRSVVSIVERAAALLGDELFGVRLGQQMAPKDFGLWAQYVVGAPTVGEMIRRSIRTLPYHISSGSFELRIASPYARWQTAIGGRPESGCRHHTDHVFGPMLTALRLYLGPTWRPARIEVTYERPSCWREIEDAFGTELRFAQPATAIVFPEKLLAARTQSPLTKAPLTFGDFRRIARSRAPRTMTEAVSAALSLRLLDGKSDLEGTAGVMGVHPRTLQRQLETDNIRYRDLLENVRIARARSLIEESAMSLTDIAFAVGYGDASAFSRAFKRHSGMSPSQARRPGVSAKDTPLREYVRGERLRAVLQNTTEPS